ncbi:MAG TPA: nitrile hydratase subunit beta [Pseudonocardia sp.]|jgi:nitrile hydratase beta subunit|uniref:nitrile hydratase subunit beta n=1 Tax=Pseudonocardia sp. TaxID=60912 RepID=UPI002C77462B|nr:nitrile hydratase subunit beta [Pseudonocardia sp.]HTF54685.1 nitrile hydratase subunit beta [Pseudonocardia sp.]
MNGPHDLGGRHGFGPVTPELDEPPWHHDWEARMHVMALACQVRGFFVLDEQRHACEQLPPVQYLHGNYYERWNAAVTGILMDKGVLDPDAFAALTAQFLAGTAARAATDRQSDGLGDTLVRALRGGASALREPVGKPAFTVGGRVTARNLNVATHHRLPSYVKAKTGTITAIPGAFTLNDSLAHGGGENPTFVYTVAFLASDLWGEAAESPRDMVYLDLFETYLLPA